MSKNKPNSKAPLQTGKSNPLKKQPENGLVSKKHWLLLFLIPVLLYSQSLKFGLTDFDDDTIIKNNSGFLSDPANIPKVFTSDAFLAETGHFYRPLQTLSFMTDIQLSGADSTWMFHLTNILLLGFICCALFALIRQFSVTVSAAFYGSLIFACHPLFVFSVAWIPARGDLQLTLFSLLSVLYFMKYLNSTRALHLMLHIVCFTLALFSKETAVALPAVYFTYVVLFGKRKNAKKLIFIFAMYLVIGVLWFWLRSIAMGSAPDNHEFQGFLERTNEVGVIAALTNLQSLPEAIFHFFIPIDIDIIPNYSTIRTAIGLILFGMIVVIFFKNRKKYAKEKLFGLVWFILLLLPAMLYKHNIIDYLHHRFLLPLGGILIFLMFLIPPQWIQKGKIKHSWVLICFLIVAGTMSFIKTRAYSDPMNFYNSAIAQNSSSDFSFNNRGVLFTDQGKFNEAIQDYTKAIEMNPQYYEAFYNRGVAYNTLGMYDDAIADNSRAIELFPEYIDALNNRGVAYYHKGMMDKAIADYSTSIRIKPNAPIAYFNRGIIYHQQGFTEKAMADYTKAIELKPDYDVAYYNRSMIYIAQADNTLACNDLRKAADLGYQPAIESVKTLCK
ncbi:MAG TPA: tetratricopeptide repeat protein [Bacteroidales bacterium]|nr:tetratricopeptide repeat protein [Bacteroidales bacterium]